MNQPNQSKQLDVTLLFDNAGGLAVQIETENGVRWAHFYTDMQQAACDVFTATLYPAHVAMFDGHEPAALERPTTDALERGAYRIFNVTSTRELFSLCRAWVESDWSSVSYFGEVCEVGSTTFPVDWANMSSFSNHVVGDQ